MAKHSSQLIGGAWHVIKHDENGNEQKRYGPFPNRHSAENSVKARNGGWETDE